jgi:hypothetical protein
MSGFRRVSPAGPAVLAFCVCFAVAAVFSGAWAVLHADHVHDCDGADGGCSVCAQIAAAWDVLRQLGGMSVCETSAPVFSAAAAVPAPGRPAARSLTLAELKIRMNN